MSARWMTGFMQVSKLTASPAKAAAAAKWTGSAGRRHCGDLWELDADDDGVAFFQAVGDFRAGAVADANLDRDGLRRRVAGTFVGGKNVNGARRGLRTARTKTAAAARAKTTAARAKAATTAGSKTAAATGALQRAALIQLAELGADVRRNFLAARAHFRHTLLQFLRRFVAGERRGVRRDFRSICAAGFCGLNRVGGGGFAFLAQGIRRPEAQRGIGDFQHAGTRRRDDGGVGRHAWPELQIGIADLDDHVVSDDILNRGGRIADLPDFAGKLAVGKSVHGKTHVLSLLNA